MSGYVDRLPDDVLLDVGVLFHGGTAVGVTLGPSRGGLRFTPGLDVRNVPYDGQAAPTVGLDLKIFTRSSFSGVLILFGPEDLQRFEPGNYRGTLPSMASLSIAEAAAMSIAAAAAAAIAGPAPAIAGKMFTEGQYLKDLVLRHRRGNGGFVDIIFAYALCTQYELAGQNQSEVEVTATFEARLEHTGLDGACPYAVLVTDPEES